MVLKGIAQEEPEGVNGPIMATDLVCDAEGIDQRYVARVIRLAMLSPDITKVIFAGREPQDLTSDRFGRQCSPQLAPSL